MRLWCAVSSCIRERRSVLWIDPGGYDAYRIRAAVSVSAELARRNRGADYGDRTRR